MVTLKAQKADSIFGSQGATKTYVKSKINAISASPHVDTPPGGSNTQIQFNNSGAFGASSKLTFNGTTLYCSEDLDVDGDIGQSAGDATFAGAGLFMVSRSVYFDGPIFEIGIAPAGVFIKGLPNAPGATGQLWVDASTGVLYVTP